MGTTTGTGTVLFHVKAQKTYTLEGIRIRRRLAGALVAGPRPLPYLVVERMTMKEVQSYTRLLVAVLLVAAQAMYAESNASGGSLYAKTVTVDTVLLSAGNNTFANAGGIYLENSTLNG